MVSILQCPKTPKQVFVAKYLFLEQNKQIWDEPVCSGHIFAAPMVSAIERFHCILILKGIMTFLKSESPCILLNKNTNFIEKETELKMGNPTHISRETKFALQLI